MDSKTPEPKEIDKLTIVSSVIYAVLLVGVILFKVPFGPDDSERAINLIPLQGSFTDNGTLRLAEVIENIFIFIPLGAYICMLKTNWAFTKKVIFIVSVTVAFEIAQFILAMGKSDITDVLGNTLGGIIGIGLYILLEKVFKNRTDKIVNVSALALMICFVVFIASLSARRWLS